MEFPEAHTFNLVAVPMLPIIATQVKQHIGIWNHHAQDNGEVERVDAIISELDCEQVAVIAFYVDIGAFVSFTVQPIN